MYQKLLSDFLVIDDDPINNLICNRIIQLTYPGASVKTFTDPQKGLDHILSAYSETDARDTILFLDINMPVLSGWDVLDKMRDFPVLVKGRITTLVLSSSVAAHDKEKADNNELVFAFISKPLSQANLKEIFSRYEK